MADLLISNARLLATMDGDRRELTGGWVSISDGLVEAVGQGEPPVATTVIDATDCLVTPGLINTHHHLFQNLTRAFPPMTDKPLFGWLQSLYPLWRAIDTDAVHVSAWVGLAELALSGCTTSTDHLYLHPKGAGDLLTAEIEAARDLGVRFHPTRGSMSLSEKDGGLPPDDVVADDDDILAASEEAVAKHHDRSWGARTRIALAPCSPFSVTEQLMVRTAELAERLDVRLHTHFAENDEDDEFSLETFGCRPMEYLERTGWATDRTWVAHCVKPDDDEIRRLGAAGVGAAHCPSSNLILASGIAPVVALRAAGVPVGLGVDGSSSADAASLWLEARQAMLLAKLRDGAHAGTARMALEIATLGGAACLGRTGELGVLEPGAVGDVAVWSLDGPIFAGALADPIEAWLRCGPVAARDTVVHGTPVVQGGRLVSERVDEMVQLHTQHSRRIQQR
ncbi:cytosine/adenosine deaminase-related metal-dependent hydrolase [Ilumatobacter fluminis]|uniref:Cytosine/adenosine deaminase-related metal-dependent hydrolase n=1 Tax=Ilumatobacter fluminis TaxID=467091 RepID=A0A4R7HXY3_9ACTN|nr:8-oxoguanine deaminase [Ilumatobacter fluminis]TDT15076.1 cytosine/adenosine deaminase-related metal-dependent hydrolase [Ilumatobacter fluminis]